MIQHIKNSAINKILSIAIAIFFLSCGKPEAKKSDKPIAQKESTVQVPATREEAVVEKNHDGIWKFEKAALIGGYKSGTDYYYNQAQLDTLHKNLVIEIKDGKITFGSKCTSAIIETQLPADDFFAGKAAKNTSASDIESFFKKDFNVNLKEEITLLEAKCAYPFNKILAFPDRLILVEYGAFYFSFKKVKNK